MSSHERVLTAFAFETPDRIPRFDGFWSFPPEWEERLGPQEGLSDIAIWVPNEGAFPTRARRIREEGDWVYEVDAWGRTYRHKVGKYFTETLEVPIPEGTDPDNVVFDAPSLDERYLKDATEAETLARLKRDKERFCVFGKTGGPYLRTTFVRGEEQFFWT